MADVLPSPPDRAVLARRAAVRSARTGWLIVGLVFGGLAYWSIFAPFEGAVLSRGQITVESNQQAVQHLEGGIVKAIHVSEADSVTQGQVLISLDGTVVEAATRATESQLIDLLATEARLVAERDGGNTLTLRHDFSVLHDTPQMSSALDLQTSLFRTRQDSWKTQSEILNQRIRQLQAQIEGMRRQTAALEDQHSLLDDEIVRFEALVSQGNASVVRVLALKRERARLVGAIQSLGSDIAATQVRIGETRNELIGLSQQRTEQILSHLTETQKNIDVLSEQFNADLDRQKRLVIRAPRSGRVIGVRAHTVGGVIAASDPLMFIVPEGDRLVAKVQVRPSDIDRVSVGQKAILRFPAFDQSETPKVVGHIAQLSADSKTDPVTGASFFEAVITLSGESGPALNLLPGMPVEASLKTESRNVLSYLVKPLSDSLSHAFRE